jgi:hypothetical protein
MNRARSLYWYSNTRNKSYQKSSLETIENINFILQMYIYYLIRIEKRKLYSNMVKRKLDI